MAWIVLIVLVLVMLTLVASKPRQPQPGVLDRFTDAELLRAARQLHAINQRLKVSWVRHELRSEASRLRRELAEEIQRVKTLEGAKRLEK